MPRKILDLELSEISLVGDPANPLAKVVLYKSAPKVAPVEKAQCRLCKTNVDEGDKYCRDCGAPFYKKETMDPKDTPPVTEPTPAPVEKKDDKVEKALAEQVAKAAALEAEVAQLRKAQKVRDRRDDIAKTMSSVPADMAVLAERMVELESRDAELAKYFEGILKSANELLKKSDILKQASTSSQVDLSDAEAELDRRADELVKSKPGLTKSQAYREVLHNDPALYAKYRDSK